MKKVIFFVFAFLLFTLPLTAKDNPNDNKVVLTLKDGTIVQGYLSGDLFSDMVKISENFHGKSQKYSTNDILTLKLTPNDTTSFTFIPMLVYDYWKLSGKKSKNPLLLMPIYETERMIGFIAPDTDFSMAPNALGMGFQFIFGTVKYFYYIKGEERAYSFWKVQTGKPIGLKKSLKKYPFKRLKYVCDYIDSKDFDSSAFQDNPMILLPIIDEALQRGLYEPEKL